MELDSAIVYTNDLDASILFYQDVVGLELAYRHDDSYASFLFTNNSQLGIKRASDAREMPGYQTVIVKTGNVRYLHKTFKTRGIDVSKLIAEDWGERFKVFDPDGNKIEFCQRAKA